MKRRVGYLFGKPIVQGDENLVGNFELLAKKTRVQLRYIREMI